MTQRVRQASPALKFVLTAGIMSFFADFTYEGSRSIIGPCPAPSRSRLPPSSLRSR